MKMLIKVLNFLAIIVVLALPNRALLAQDYTVSIDAQPSIVRTYYWWIGLEGDREQVILDYGQSTFVNFNMELDATPIDQYAVRGIITVYNPHPTKTIRVWVDHQVDGIRTWLDCNGALSVAPLSSATCRYSIDLPDTSTRTSTATVSDGGRSLNAAAPVDFSTAVTEVIDECVYLFDPIIGRDTVCASSLPWWREYQGHIAGFTCGTFPLRDEATFTTSDTGVMGSAGWDLQVEVRCG